MLPLFSLWPFPLPWGGCSGCPGAVPPPTKGAIRCATVLTIASLDCGLDQLPLICSYVISEAWSLLPRSFHLQVDGIMYKHAPNHTPPLPTHTQSDGEPQCEKRMTGDRGMHSDSGQRRRRRGLGGSVPRFPFDVGRQVGVAAGPRAEYQLGVEYCTTSYTTNPCMRIII